MKQLLRSAINRKAHRLGQDYGILMKQRMTDKASVLLAQGMSYTKVCADVGVPYDPEMDAVPNELQELEDGNADRLVGEDLNVR